jgi:hypothetical protein
VPKFVADSVETTGLKWVAPAGGGKVLQVVMDDLTTDFTTTSTSFVDTGLEVTITPSSATSKILIVSYFYAYVEHTGSQTHNLGSSALLRGATQITGANFGVFNSASSTAKSFYFTNSYNFLDSPSTTSATTYKVQAKARSAQSTSFNLFANFDLTAQIIAMEIGA